MELEAVRKFLEKSISSSSSSSSSSSTRDDDKKAASSSAAVAASSSSYSTIESMPLRFFESFVMEDLRVHLIESGVSFVPSKSLSHGGATAMLVDLVGSAVTYSEAPLLPAVSVEINISFLDASYLDEEIEIEAKNLLVGKAIAVASVEFRNKTTGKIIAQGCHTKYFTVASKL